MTEAPTVRCWRSEDETQLVFWCRHCRREHYHGIVEPGGPLGVGDGHRVAHCDDGSPYKRTGYVLREVPPEDSRYTVSGRDADCPTETRVIRVSQRDWHHCGR